MENMSVFVPSDSIIESERPVDTGTPDDTIKTTVETSEDREMEEDKPKEEKIVDQWISNLNQWNYTPQNNELRQGYRILKELMSEGNKSVNWPFMDAVDIEATGLYDYYERVKKPMWLRKMKSRFELEEYDSITEFVSDFRQMLENCYRYNGPDHYVSKRGQRLETMMEQKVTLLSREIRAKTSIEATSGILSMDGRISPYGGNSRRRGKNIVPHDSTALLNQLRLEEAQKERDARKQQIQERRAVQEAYAQGVQDWEDKLLEEPIKTQLQHMWELPQIGLFLFLCQGPLNIGEVIQFELERCFAMARESTTLQAVMTTLLSTPYQRTRLEKKPMMPYNVWEEKLRTRIRLWYKSLHDLGDDAMKAATKIGIDPYFFTVLGKKNALEKKKFHKLSFYRKVWIVKSLCDHCLENQESIRDAVECQPIEEQREYFLGKDAEDNTYLHFPQFCGADLRIYRQAPILHPKMNKVVVSTHVHVQTATARRKKFEEVKASIKKKKKIQKKKDKEKTVIPTPPPPRPSRPSRLRQNIKPVLPLVLSESSESSSSSEEEEEEETGTEVGAISMDDSSTCSSSLTNSSIRTRASMRMLNGSLSSKDGTPEPLSFRGKIRRPRLPVDASSNKTGPDCDRNDEAEADVMNDNSQEIQESSEDGTLESGIGNCQDGIENDIREAESEATPTPSRDPSPMEVDGESTCSPVLESSDKSSGNPARTSFAGEVNSTSNGTCNNLASYSDTNSCGPPSEDRALCNGKLETRAVQSDSVCNNSAIGENQECKDGAIVGMGINSGIDTVVKRGNEDCQEEGFSVNNSLNNQATKLEIDIQRSDHRNIKMKDEYDENPSASNVILSDETNRMSESPLETEGNELCSGTCSLSILANMALANICTESGHTEQTNQFNEAVSNPVQNDMTMGNAAKLESAYVDNETTVPDVKTEPVETTISMNPLCTNEIGKTIVHCENGEMRTEISQGETFELKVEPNKHSLCETNMDTEFEQCESKPDLQSMDTVTMVTKFRVECGVKVDQTERFNLENMTNGGFTVKSETAEIKVEKADSTVTREKDMLRDTKEGILDDVNAKTKPMVENLQTVEGTVEGSDKGDNCKRYNSIGGSGKRAGLTNDKTDDGQNTLEQEDSEDEEVTPEIGSFRLMADNVESLRLLVEQFAEPEVIVTPRGKKEKMSRPPVRKRCVSELYRRLLFLLKELEPWESKLYQASKKARLKLRKEHEDYMDEEQKKNIEDVWDSEESVTSSEESSSDEEETTTVDPKSQPLPRSKSKSNRKTTLEIDAASTGTNTPDEDELNISSRGRILKRRVIPNNVEDPGPKKRKVIKSLEENFSSASHVPNILQKHHMVKADSSNIFFKTMPISLLDSSTKQGVTPVMSASQMLLKANLSAKQAQGIPLSSLSLKDLANVTVLTRSPNKSSEFGQQRVTSHPVIQQLLTKKAPVLIAQANKLQPHQIQAKLTAHPLPLTVIPQSKIDPLAVSTAVQVFASSSSAVTVAGNKTRKIEIAKPRQTAVRLTLPSPPSPRKATPGKVQLYNHNILSSLPPEVIQQLLKTQALRIQTVTSGSTGAPKVPAGGAIILSSPTKPSPALTPTTQTAYKTMNPSISPVKINIPLQTVLTSPVSQEDSSAAVASPAQKPKYACHVTVKSLLKDKAKKALESRTGDSDGMETDDGKDTNIIPSAAQVLSLASEVSQQLPSVLSASQIQQPIIVTVNTAIKGLPQTLKLPSKETLDSAVQAVVTSVKTTLPTAHLKVPAPSTMPSIQPRKNVTKTIQSMKSPIPVIGTSMGRNTTTTFSTTAVSSPSQTGGHISIAVQSKPAMAMSTISGMHHVPITTLTASTGVSANTKVQHPNSPSGLGMSNSMKTSNHQLAGSPSATPQNSMLLRMVPQTFLTSQGLVQGFLTPQGLVITQSSLQHNTAEIAKPGLVLHKNASQQQPSLSNLQQQRQVILSTPNQQLQSQLGVSTVIQQQQSQQVLSTLSQAQKSQLGVSQQQSQLGVSTLNQGQKSQLGVSRLNQQQQSQLGVSTLNQQQQSQLGVSTLNQQQQSQLGASTLNQQQQSQLGVSTLNQAQKSQLGISTLNQQQQSQLGVSTLNQQQQSQLGIFTLNQQQRSQLGGSTLNQQQQSQLGVSTLNQQQQSQLGVSTLNQAQKSQLGVSTLNQQQRSQLGVSTLNQQQQSQLGVSTLNQQQQSQLGVSTLNQQQPSQLGVSAADLQRLVQISMANIQQQNKLGVSASNGQIQNQLGSSALNQQQIQLSDLQQLVSPTNTLQEQVCVSYVAAGLTVKSQSSPGLKVVSPPALQTVTSVPGQLPGKIVKPGQIVTAPNTELNMQAHKPPPNIQIAAGTSTLLATDTGGQLKSVPLGQLTKPPNTSQNMPINSAVSNSTLLLQAANSALQKKLACPTQVGNSLKPHANISKQKHPVLTESLMKGLNIKIETSFDLFKKGPVGKVERNSMQPPSIVNQKGDGIQSGSPSAVGLVKNMAYGAGDTLVQQNVENALNMQTSVSGGNLVTLPVQSSSAEVSRIPINQENFEQERSGIWNGIQRPSTKQEISQQPQQNATAIARALIKPGNSEQSTLSENSGLPAAHVLLSLSQSLTVPAPVAADVPDKSMKMTTSKGHDGNVTTKAETAVGKGSTNVPMLNLQTQSQMESPQKLLLFNFNGQLYTQQGIPVTLDNGVLKIAGPTTSHGSQPQSATVLATSSHGSTDVTQSQIVKQFTPSKPVAQLLKTMPTQQTQPANPKMAIQANSNAVSSRMPSPLKPVVTMPTPGDTTVLNQQHALQQNINALVQPVSTVDVQSAAQSKPLQSPTQVTQGTKKGKVTVKQLITSPTRKIQPQPVAVPATQGTLLTLPGGQAMQLMGLSVQQQQQQTTVRQNRQQMMVPGMLLADSVQGKVHVAQPTSPLLNQLTLRPMVQNVISPMRTTQRYGIVQPANNLQPGYSSVISHTIPQPASTVMSTTPVIQQQSQLRNAVLTPTSVPQSPVLLQMTASSPRQLLSSPNTTQLSTQAVRGNPSNTTVVTAATGVAQRTTKQSS